MKPVHWHVRSVNPVGWNHYSNSFPSADEAEKHRQTKGGVDVVPCTDDCEEHTK